MCYVDHLLAQVHNVIDKHVPSIYLYSHAYFRSARDQMTHIFLKFIFLSSFNLTSYFLLFSPLSS